jgi:hypothetical protein
MTPLAVHIGSGLNCQSIGSENELPLCLTVLLAVILFIAQVIFAWRVFGFSRRLADWCIGFLAGSLGMCQDQSIQLLHNWIEIAVETLRFPLLAD